MKVKQLLQDDDAVSPVIGVILMVAITVILAAVIATFVLGLGEQVSNTAPQASFSFDYAEVADDDDDFSSTVSDAGDGLLTITHSTGATIQANQLYLTGGELSATTAWSEADSYGSNSEISAGDSITLRVAGDDTVRVVWRSDTGQDSATLNNWEGPGA